MVSRKKKVRKKKPGRKPLRVKIEGNPLPVIDRMLGRDGSSLPKKKAAKNRESEDETPPDKGS